MPTEKRMKNFMARDDGNRVAFAHFLRVRSENLNRTLVDASRHWNDDVEGERIYAGNLDVVRGRSALSFDQLLGEALSIPGSGTFERSMD